MVPPNGHAVPSWRPLSRLLGRKRRSNPPLIIPRTATYVFPEALFAANRCGRAKNYLPTVPNAQMRSASMRQIFHDPFVATVGERYRIDHECRCILQRTRLPQAAGSKRRPPAALLIPPLWRPWSRHCWPSRLHAVDKKVELQGVP
jgi:hypothetical protein